MQLKSISYRRRKLVFKYFNLNKYNDIENYFQSKSDKIERNN